MLSAKCKLLEITKVLDTHDSFGQHLHPLQTTQDIDADRQVEKSETIEKQDFFVNGHVIERTVKKNGKPKFPTSRGRVFRGGSQTEKLRLSVAEKNGQVRGTAK